MPPIVGLSNMSKLGTAPWSSIGRSTTVMKSVPSPGSSAQTPSGADSDVPSLSLLWSLILACNCSKRLSFSASALSALPAAKAASGIASSCPWFTVTSSEASFACSPTMPASMVDLSSSVLWGVSAAAIGSVSFFGLRPRRFGWTAATSSVFFTASSCEVISSSLKSDFCSTVVLLFFASRFSPSFPFTV